MRYHVNLYPEREARAGTLRRHLLRGAAFGVVAGIEILLIGFLVVSGFELRERVRTETRTVESLEAEAKPVSETDDVATARSLVQARVDRVDWSRVLMAVSGALPKTVILSKIEGGVGGRQSSLNGMNLEGRISGGGTDLAPVLGFMQALRESAAVTSRFPQVDLGTAPSPSQPNFQVIVRAPETKKDDTP